MNCEEFAGRRSLRAEQSGFDGGSGAGLDKAQGFLRRRPRGIGLWEWRTLGWLEGLRSSIVFT